ncbi:peptidylprolyl isomerase [Acidobacteriota bacterium]
MLKNLFLGITILSFLLTLVSTGQSASANPKVLIKTSKGDMTVELYEDKAPISVQNFLSYVDDKYYDATIFHRVIKGFMIQGGGFTTDFQKKPTKPSIKNEAGNGLKNKKGTLAMARTMDINSATSQFFINHVNNAFLDHKDDTEQGFGYCVFAIVTEGLDVVDTIANAPTMIKNGYNDVPRETIEIISIRRVE